MINTSELKSLDKTKEDKEKIFAGSEATTTEYRSYLRFKKQINAIKTPVDLPDMKEQAWNDNANQFLHLWESYYSSPENKLDLTHLVLFEKSFEFFAERSTDFYHTKGKIIKMQLEVLTSDLPSELKNSLLGMWSYYLDTYFESEEALDNNQTYSSTDRNNKDQAIADNLREDLMIFIKKEINPLSQEELNKINQSDRNIQKTTLSPKEINYLRIATDSQTDYKDDELQQIVDDGRYFGSLFANDIQATELIDGILFNTDRDGGDKDRKNKYDQTGIKMSPHDRWYTYVKNRLPRPSSLEKGRVLMCLAEKRKKNSKGEFEEVVGIRIPETVMDLYIMEMDSLRHTEDYRISDEDLQQELRKTTENIFIYDLLDPNSKIRKKIREIESSLEPYMDGLLEKINLEEELRIYTRMKFNSETN